jgi:predicted component of type VI protein secretion system
METQYQFVLRSGETSGSVYPLVDAEIMIGRDTSCGLVIPDAEVSRKHARLIWQVSNYVIEDVGSTNGTFINGQRLLTPFVLHGGETVTLGEKVVLVFEAIVDPDATRLSASLQAIRKADVGAEPALQNARPAEVEVMASSPAHEPMNKTPSSSVSISNQARVTPIYDQPLIDELSDRRRNIILIVLLVILLIGFVIAISIYNAPPSFWCRVLPFIFNPRNFICTP